jgi:hypothetical protein
MEAGRIRETKVMDENNCAPTPTFRRGVAVQNPYISRTNAVPG